MRFLDSTLKLFRVPPLSDAEAAKWVAIRVRGRRRYILMDGVLKWGLFMAFGVSIVRELFYFVLPGAFLGVLAMSLVLFPLGGSWVGQKMWTVSERRHLAWRRRSGTAAIDHG